ncbi:hypothetical protein D3C84_463400 [compost metagenome]
MVIGGRVIVGERAPATGLLIIPGVGADVVPGKDAPPGLFQRPRVDVGRVDEGAFQQPLLAQQNRQRIDLFPGAATGDPEFDRRVGLEQRHHFLANGQKVRRVTKHLADRNRQQLQQLHERGRVVQHPLLQGRDGPALELMQRVVDPTLNRRCAIIAEIVTVFEIDRFDQQPQFDLASGTRVALH